MLEPRYVPASAAQRRFSLEPGALSGRVIAVTGASGGLGTALAFALGAAGATPVLIGRSEKKLDKLYDALLAAGAPQPAIVPLAQETAGEDAYAELAALLGDELGGLDALVHAAAAYTVPTPLGAVSQADWARVGNVNVAAARLATLACLPLLAESPLGSVTFLLDHRPGAYWGAYGVSKQGVHALMHMLAEESDGRRGEDGHPRLAVNGYDPGPMRTPLRRRFFPGERERESPLPAERLGPLLALVTREARASTGLALQYEASAA